MRERYLKGMCERVKRGVIEKGVFHGEGVRGRVSGVSRRGVVFEV